MARPRTLDRDAVLDAAEAVIVRDGVGGFSLGAVAAAAAMPKASVQSAFKHKEGLTQALLERWMAEEHARFDIERDGEQGARERVLAHVRTTQALTDVARDRLAVLLALLDQGPDPREAVQTWYRERMGDLRADTPEERRLRLALAAAEGAFFLRFLNLVPMTPEVWNDLLDDIVSLAWE